MTPVVSEEYREKKKQEIIEHALVCFAEKGFQAATIDDIVKRSKMSKGSIYTYFQSKEDIYVALMNEKTEISTQHLKEELKKFDSSIEKIRFIFDIFKSQAGRSNWIDRVKVHTEFYLHASRDPDLRSLLIERAKHYYINVLVDVLEEGKMAGEIKTTTDSEIAANLFWSMLDGINFQYSALQDHYPYEDVLEEAKAMYIKSLM
ncbi:TetR/AcrR family transcriptional regulator [Bacillus salitolerans]|uniref:TetR/AcrR family transcriptional regulator n=1 Tax=Bacillus salitolerans TaxID=1437434 RepID=A0ABW4LWA7_9BACI